MPLNVLDWNRRRYNLWAPLYGRMIGPLLDRQRRRSIELLDLRPGERVLIVGAGPGVDLPHLPSTVSITAVDIASAMIGRLRDQAGRLRLAVDARVMDAQALDLPDESFDAAILHLILAVVPDPIRCARQVARVLRPRGRAVILDKFLPEGRLTRAVFRAVNPLTRLLATDVTRRLPPILEASGLTCIYEEAAGLNGILRIAVASRP